LELQYRKPFLEIWEDEKNDRELGPLSERMGVRDRNTGDLLMTEEEKDAVSKCLDPTRCGSLLTFGRFLSCFLFLQGLKLHLSQPPMHTLATLL
jgi:mRNA (guanine-N7-)-methyltransferase